MKSGTDDSNQQKHNTKITSLSFVRPFLSNNSIAENVVSIVTINEPGKDQDNCLELNTLNERSLLREESVGVEVNSQKREKETDQIHHQRIA